MVKCEEVIITKMQRRGNGTEAEPVRILTQVWTKDGDLIAERDPHYNRSCHNDQWMPVEDFYSIKEILIALHRRNYILGYHDLELTTDQQKFIMEFAKTHSPNK